MKKVLYFLFLSSSFAIGRDLSKNLFSCIEEILPAIFWKQIIRIAVAIGPGGFTGTRLTITMARTLAQQINCQLDGISSFSLMAPRLYKNLSFHERMQPFWIIQSLQRRGVIGGQYKILVSEKQQQIRTIEIQSWPLFHSKPQSYYSNPIAISLEDKA